MKISGKNTISGMLTVSQTGYSAEKVREKYTGDGADKYYTSLREKHKEWKIAEINLENVDNLGAVMSQQYTLSSEDIVQENGNLISFNALLEFGQKQNPFMLEKRETVVDLVYPIKDTYLFTIEIPEGFSVESVPESVRLMLPDQAGSFLFVASVAGNKVTVNSALSITKIMYNTTEYADLREFFTRIVAKHAQQIVLKKA
jgi:hypothetical protein